MNKEDVLIANREQKEQSVRVICRWDWVSEEWEAAVVFVPPLSDYKGRMGVGNMSLCIGSYDSALSYGREFAERFGMQLEDSNDPA